MLCFKLNGRKIVTLFVRDSFVRLVTRVRVSRTSEIFNPDDRGSRLEYSRAYRSTKLRHAVTKIALRNLLGRKGKGDEESYRRAIDSRRYFVASYYELLHAAYTLYTATYTFP